MVQSLRLCMPMTVEGGKFTIGKELRTKIENIFLKIVSFWTQYYFRDTYEAGLVEEDDFPEEPEDSEE